MIVLIVLSIFVLFYPIKINKNSISGYEAIRNDILADKFKPSIILNNEFDNPYKILYRASVDDEGNTYIAYHIFWSNEVNLTNGIMPFLSKNIYTGGLKIQKFMYGKEDVEVIEIKLNSKNEIVRIQYETAEDYNTNNFSVKHKNVVVSGNDLEAYKAGELAFKVISWNHLFELNELEGVNIDEKEIVNLDVNYFNNEEWKNYKMIKKVNTLLKKDRAHYDYEIEYIY